METKRSATMLTVKLEEAIARIEARVDQSRGGARSSTTQLLAANPKRLIAKLQEEVNELIEAFQAGDQEEVAAETADVLYPLAVMSGARGMSLRDAFTVFAEER